MTLGPRRISGLASLVCDCVAAAMHDINFDFTSQTVHPTYGSYRRVKELDAMPLQSFDFQSNMKQQYATWRDLTRV